MGVGDCSEAHREKLPEQWEERKSEYAAEMKWLQRLDSGRWLPLVPEVGDRLMVIPLKPEVQVLSAEEDVPLGTVKGSSNAVESSKLVVELIKMKNYVYLRRTREQ